MARARVEVPEAQHKDPDAVMREAFQFAARSGGLNRNPRELLAAMIRESGFSFTEASVKNWLGAGKKKPTPPAHAIYAVAKVTGWSVEDLVAAVLAQPLPTDARVVQMAESLATLRSLYDAVNDQLGSFHELFETLRDRQTNVEAALAEIKAQAEGSRNKPDKS